MEFEFRISDILGKEGLVIIDRAKLNEIKSRSVTNYQNVCNIIDQMGLSSAKAQKLGSVITTSAKLQSSDHKVYFLYEDRQAFGILKVGSKKLFIMNQNQQYVELTPLCVLDFYVHESKQRSGLGKVLFEKMLQIEKVKAVQCAYDRPSEKLLGFLSKHYKLRQFIPQPNSYVVFNKFFKSSPNENEEEEEIMNLKILSSFPPPATRAHKRYSSLSTPTLLTPLNYEDSNQRGNTTPGYFTPNRTNNVYKNSSTSGEYGNFHNLSANKPLTALQQPNYSTPRKLNPINSFPSEEGYLVQQTPPIHLAPPVLQQPNNKTHLNPVLTKPPSREKGSRQVGLEPIHHFAPKKETDPQRPATPLKRDTTTPLKRENSRPPTPREKETNSIVRRASVGTINNTLNYFQQQIEPNISSPKIHQSESFPINRAPTPGIEQTKENSDLEEAKYSDENKKENLTEQNLNSNQDLANIQKAVAPILARKQKMFSPEFQRQFYSHKKIF